MEATVTSKGRVVVQDSQGKIIGNLDPQEAVKLGLALLDAGKKAAEKAGMTGED